MSTELIPVSPATQPPSLAWLRAAVLASVSSPHSRRNYAQALDELAGFLNERSEPLSRVALLRYRQMLLERRLSASTVNVRLSAIRKLVTEARRHGFSMRRPQAR